MQGLLSFGLVRRQDAYASYLLIEAGWRRRGAWLGARGSSGQWWGGWLLFWEWLNGGLFWFGGGRFLRLIGLERRPLGLDRSLVGLLRLVALQGLLRHNIGEVRE